MPVLLFVGVGGQREELDETAGDVHAGVGQVAAGGLEHRLQSLSVDLHRRGEKGQWSATREAIYKGYKDETINNDHAIHPNIPNFISSAPQ